MQLTNTAPTVHSAPAARPPLAIVRDDVRPWVYISLLMTTETERLAKAGLYAISDLRIAQPSLGRRLCGEQVAIIYPSENRHEALGIARLIEGNYDAAAVRLVEIDDVALADMGDAEAARAVEAARAAASATTLRLVEDEWAVSHEAHRAARQANETAIAEAAERDAAGEEPVDEAEEAFEREAAVSRADRARRIAIAAAAARETEMGNSEVFMLQHGDDVMYAADAKQWHLWNGHVWAADEDGELMRRIGQSARTLNASKAWQKSSEGRSTQEHVAKFIAEARRQDGTSVRAKLSDCDRQTELVAVANGVLDLRTGALTAPDRRHLITRALPVAYDASAACPTWLRFIEAACCKEDGLTHDPEVAAYLQAYLGYCLTGRVDAQLAVWLFGSGGNGKGVIVGVMERILGAFRTVLPMATLMEKSKHTDDTTPNPYIANLCGARMAVASEGDDQVALDQPLLKWLTGGDTITARSLRTNPITFRPTHKLVIMTNLPPIIRNVGPATERRIRVIPLHAKFRKVKDTDVVRAPTFRSESELWAELPGIVNWLLEGAKRWIAAKDADPTGNGMPRCEAVDRVTAKFLAQDEFTGFLGDATEPAAGQRVEAGALYRAYTAWCDERRSQPMSSTKFGRELGKKGFDAEHSGRGYRKGLRLTERGQELADSGVAF